MKSLAIRHKIALTVLFMLALSVGIVLVMLEGFNKVKESIRMVAEVYEPANQASYEMEINVVEMGFGVMKYLETGHPQYRVTVEDDEVDFRKFYAQWEDRIQTPEAHALDKELEPAFEEFLVLGNTLMAQRDQFKAIMAEAQGKTSTQRAQDVERTMRENIKAFLATRQTLDDILDEGIQAMAARDFLAAKEHADRTSADVRQMLVIAIPFLLILGGGGGLWLFRGIMGPLRHLQDGIEALNRGEMHVRAKVVGQDELGRVAEQFNQMVENRAAITQALSHSEERFQLAVRATNDAVWEWNVQTGHVWISESFLALFGYSKEELLPTRDFFTSRYHPDDATTLMSEVETLLDGRAETWDAEYRFRRGCGSYAHIHDRAFVVRDEIGAAIRMVGAMEDITARKRIEQTLQHAHNDLERQVFARTDALLLANRTLLEQAVEQKKLETQLLHAQKMDAVGRLAGGIAHDFNNVLTAIMGYSGLLLTDSSSPETRRKHAEQIQKSADRAAAMTRQLLAFSRRQVMTPTVLDPSAAVTTIAPMLQRLIGEHITLVIVPNPNEGWCRSDAGHLDQVIMNLAVNARDAMPDGGTLTIETATVMVDEAACHASGWYEQPALGPYVMVAVSDQGCGMDEATKAHVFEPFFTTKAEGKGTGLGLSTVYGIVKQSGGYLWFTSEPAQGTTFKFYLPLVNKATSLRATQQAGPSAPVRGTETLLLVEDDAEIRDLAAAMLESCGYVLIQAADGDAAIRLSEQHGGAIHCLVTDVVMPGMNGRKLASHLLVPYPQMKVLYLSGHTDDVLLHHGVSHEEMAFLQKPFTLETLKRKVRALLDASSFQPGV